MYTAEGKKTMTTIAREDAFDIHYSFMVNEVKQNSQLNEEVYSALTNKANGNKRAALDIDEAI